MSDEFYNIVSALIVSIFGFASAALSSKVSSKKISQVVKWLGGSIAVLSLAVTIFLAWAEIIPDPQITISTNLEDKVGNILDVKDAPYEIFVRGTLSNTKKLYVYLVVDDGNAQWIQPDVTNTNSEFTGYAYLGEPNDQPSNFKRYSVYAVLVDKKYKVKDKLDTASVIAYSNRVELIRTK
jgi:hypothetical protein